MPLSVTDAATALKTTPLNILRLIALGKLAGTRTTSKEVFITPEDLEKYVKSGAPLFTLPPLEMPLGNGGWFDYRNLSGAAVLIVNTLQRKLQEPAFLESLRRVTRPRAIAAATNTPSYLTSGELDPTKPGFSEAFENRRKLHDRLTMAGPAEATVTIDDLSTLQPFYTQDFDNTFNPNPIKARHGEIVAPMIFLNALRELVRVAGAEAELIDPDIARRMLVPITKKNAVVDGSADVLPSMPGLFALYYTPERFQQLTSIAWEIALAEPAAVFTQMVEIPELRDPYVRVQMSVTMKPFADACGVTLASVVEKYL